MRIHYFDNNNEFYVCISTVQILENVAIEADLEKGEAYFEGSVKFMKTLNEVLDMLIGEVSIITANSILSLSYEDIHFCHDIHKYIMSQNIIDECVQCKLNILFCIVQSILGYTI